MQLTYHLGCRRPGFGHRSSVGQLSLENWLAYRLGTSEQHCPLQFPGVHCIPPQSWSFAAWGGVKDINDSTLAYLCYNTRKYHEFVLLRVCSTSNNANGNKRVNGIAWYYGDNDFIIQTFDFIARSNAAHVTCST